MERPRNNSKENEHSAAQQSAARGARWPLDVAPWPRMRRTLRPEPRSLASEASAPSLSSNIAAQAQGSGGCIPRSLQRSRPLEGSSSRLSLGLERKIPELGAGDTSTEQALQLCRLSTRRGSGLDMRGSGLQERPEADRGVVKYHGAAGAGLGEGARRPSPAPSVAAGRYQFLDPGELPSEAADYRALVQKAMEDQEMTRPELARLAELILDKAGRDATCAVKATEICEVIIGGQHAEDFVSCLINACRRWFKEREEKLPRATSLADLHQIREKGPRARVWTAYVTFVVGVLAALSRRQGSARDRWILVSLFELSVLLCNCFELMLSRPDLKFHTEMNLFLWAVSKTGWIFHEAAPERFKSVIRCAEDTLRSPQCTDEARTALSHVLELRASGWHQHEEGGTQNGQ